MLWFFLYTHTYIYLKKGAVRSVPGSVPLLGRSNSSPVGRGVAPVCQRDVTAGPLRQARDGDRLVLCLRAGVGGRPRAGSHPLTGQQGHRGVFVLKWQKVKKKKIHNQGQSQRRPPQCVFCTARSPRFVSVPSFCLCFFLWVWPGAAPPRLAQAPPTVSRAPAPAARRLGAGRF